MQRNFSVDTLRFICAFMVILIHCDDHPWEPLYWDVTQLAVPCFFVISGYLCYSDRKTVTPRLFRSLKKIAFVLVASALFYLPVQCYRFYPNVMEQVFSAEHWIYLILFNRNPAAYHLWYLNAYLYVLFIAYWISRYRGWNKAFQLIIPLFLLQIVIALYVYNQGIENGIYYYRNYLFVGLPYFLVGAFLRNLLGTKRIKALRHKRRLLLGVLIGLYFVDYAAMASDGFSDLAIFGVTLVTNKIEATLLFLLVLLYPQRRPSLLSKMGERYSLYIYILHPLFLYNIFGWRDWLHATFGEGYLYFMPLLVFALSVALGEVIIRLREWRRTHLPLGV